MKKYLSLSILFTSLLVVKADLPAPANFAIDIDQEQCDPNCSIPATATWVNTDTNAGINVYISTNGGSIFDNVRSFNAGKTSSDLIKIRINEVWAIKVGYGGSTNFTITTNLWGQQRAVSAVATVLATNQVLFHFINAGYLDTAGSYIKISTAPDMSTTAGITHIPFTNGNTVDWTVTFPFQKNTDYYFTAYITNGVKTTYPSAIMHAQPNFSPNPAQLNLSYDGVLIHLSWIPSFTGGSVDQWFLDYSLDNTNNWINWYKGTSISTTDGTRTNGQHIFYRCVGSNSVGIAISNIKDFVVPYAVTSSQFFVSPTGSGGAATNWATAARNFEELPWASIRPGATVWITNATYGQLTIPAEFSTWAGGTLLQPITFRAWTNNTDKIVMTYIVNQFQRVPFIQYNFARSDTFTWRHPYEWTNNIGLQLHGDTNHAKGFYSHVIGLNFKWAEITGPYAEPNTSLFGEGTTTGFTIKDGYCGGTNGNSYVEYVYIHDLTSDNRNAGDGMVLSYQAAEQYGALQISHFLIMNVSDNFITGGANSLDMHDGYMRFWRQVNSGIDPSGVHPDGIQLGLTRSRFWNILFEGNNGYSIYPEINTSFIRDVAIYNCIFVRSAARLPAAAIHWTIESNLGIPAGQLGGPFGSGIISNVVIVNNTFMEEEENLGYTRRQDTATNMTLLGWTIKNNLYVNHTNPAVTLGFSAVYSSNNITGFDSFATNQVELDYNCAGGTNSSTFTIQYNGTTWLSTLDFGNDTGYKSNFTYLPIFRNITNQDYHLAPQDITNMHGADLTYLLPMCPGIDRDFYGTLRANTGWQPGAATVALDTNVVMWLSFNPYHGTNTAQDGSPNLNDALLFGTSSNWPGSIIGPDSRRAASIDGNQYFGVTNLARLQGMTNFTMAVWVAYTNVSGNSLILDGGYDGVTNSWRLGHVDGSVNTKFVIYNSIDGTRDYKVEFPDNGNTLVYNHYALTGDGTTIRGYYNGTEFMSTNQGISSITVGSLNHWMAVGTLHHQGTPEFGDDLYPNCCYLGGALADVFILDRAVTATEMTNIYNGTFVGASAPSSGAPSGSAPTINSFTVSPSAVTNGGIIHLAWSSPSATYLSINQGVGAVTSFSSTNIVSHPPVTYTLTATNSFGSTTAQVSVSLAVVSTNTFNLYIDGNLSIDGRLQIQ